ncbi:hypothetical protein [Pseudorhodoferax sp. Leaf267]|uniref:hypothetical protein n=1 Tax=Pseudorhodoferax sp. Leaf267 TaxID=1736316 RepID=UPI0012E1F413|nr:hypothetical protein [Pseudorhodoferax sp. Leaf267]
MHDDPHDAPPPDDDDADPLATYQRYALTTRPDGSFEGYTETNDPTDSGYPNGYDWWRVRCNSRADLECMVGKSRIGVAGCVVTVTIDGVRV